jgi:hypothetical protein
MGSWGGGGFDDEDVSSLRSSSRGSSLEGRARARGGAGAAVTEATRLGAKTDFHERLSVPFVWGGRRRSS